MDARARYIINASSVAAILGWYGEEERENVWKRKKGLLPPLEPNAAMRYGSLMESSAIATYMEHFSSEAVLSTGIWTVPSLPSLGVSPDGLRSNVVLECKCPYMNGAGYPYQKIPSNIIPQCMLEMLATNQRVLHLVSFSPRFTRIFELRFNDAFVEQLLEVLDNYADAFHSEQCPDKPSKSHLLQDLAKTIAQGATNMGHFKSYQSEDLVRSEHYSDYIAAEPPQDVPRHNKTDTARRKPAAKPRQRLREVQSFVNSSGNVGNSCYVDTILEGLFQAMTRHEIGGMNRTVQSSFEHWQRGELHQAKMLAWSLAAKRTDGEVVIGKEGSTATFYTALAETFCPKLSVHREVIWTCNVHLEHTRQAIQQICMPWLQQKHISLHMLHDGHVDFGAWLSHTLTSNDLERSGCQPECPGVSVMSSQVISLPDIFAVELELPLEKRNLPCIEHVSINISGSKFDVAAVIQFKRRHFWGEFFVNKEGYEKGFYLHDGLKNNGRATFVGKKPSLPIHGYMHVVILERANQQTASCLLHSSIISKMLSEAFLLGIITSKKDLVQNLREVADFCHLKHQSLLKGELVDLLICNEGRVMRTLAARSSPPRLADSQLQSEHNYSSSQEPPTKRRRRDEYIYM